MKYKDFSYYRKIIIYLDTSDDINYIIMLCSYIVLCLPCFLYLLNVKQAKRCGLQSKHLWNFQEIFGYLWQSLRNGQKEKRNFI